MKHVVMHPAIPWTSPSRKNFPVQISIVLRLRNLLNLLILLSVQCASQLTSQQTNFIIKMKASRILINKILFLLVYYLPLQFL